MATNGSSSPAAGGGGDAYAEDARRTKAARAWRRSGSGAAILGFGLLLLAAGVSVWTVFESGWLLSLPPLATWLASAGIGELPTIVDAVLVSDPPLIGISLVLGGLLLGLLGSVVFVASTPHRTARLLMLFGLLLTIAGLVAAVLVHHVAGAGGQRDVYLMAVIERPAPDPAMLLLPFAISLVLCLAAVQQAASGLQAKRLFVATIAATALVAGAAIAIATQPDLAATIASQPDLAAFWDENQASNPVAVPAGAGLLTLGCVLIVAVAAVTCIALRPAAKNATAGDTVVVG